MTDLSTFRITFHVSHFNISAPEIVKVFNLPTRYYYSVGEQKMSKQGIALNGVHDRTHVSFTLHDRPLSFGDNSIEEFIVNLLGTFDKENLGKVCGAGGECYFLVGVFSSGSVMFDFSASAIQRMAKDNIGFKFDFYGGED